MKDTFISQPLQSDSFQLKAEIRWLDGLFFLKHEDYKKDY